MDRCIVTGANGQVGQALLQTAPQGTIGLAHVDMDVTDEEAVIRIISRERPRVVVHAAAWTDVDGCERDPRRAWLNNSLGTAHLASACASVGAHLIYISTDYVFAGDAIRPYQPNDPVGPLSAYGWSKLGGEIAARLALGRQVTVIRTSWVFSVAGRNFVRTILRLAQAQQTLRVVNDQRGCPTYANDLADWIWTVAKSPAGGTLHACNDGDCTWYEFAVEILRGVGSQVPIAPIATAEFPRPAARPRYSVLSTASLGRAIGQRPRSWRDALRVVLEGE